MIRLLLVLALLGCKKERAPVPKTKLGNYRVYCDTIVESGCHFVVCLSTSGLTMAPLGACESR